MAYTAWSVVYGEQPTAAKWNQLGANDAGFKDGTNIDAGAINNTHIANTTIQSAKMKNDAFSQVTAGRNTTQSVANNSATTIVFNSEATDALNEYNPATGIFTAATAKRVQVSTKARYQGAIGTVTNALQIQKNNVTIYEINQPNVTAYETFETNGSLYLAAGDTVRIQVFQTSGSTQTIDNNAANVSLSIVEV